MIKIMIQLFNALVCIYNNVCLFLMNPVKTCLRQLLTQIKRKWNLFYDCFVLMISIIKHTLKFSLLQCKNVFVKITNEIKTELNLKLSLCMYMYI